MAKTTQTDDTNTEATVTPEVVKLPAVKEPELTFSAPDDNGTRWAEKKATGCACTASARKAVRSTPPTPPLRRPRQRWKRT
ncbi:hypothetical protein ACFSC4_31350 [Deinococcus malanensis]|uniref:hypothetical protein n=1 Tax=Deinococcus malanensis TaxID=1706855 RepID=UPI00362EF229